MCIMGTYHDPTNTRLYHVPIYIGNLSYNLCLYVNNLDIKNTPALMVVPIPKDTDHQLGMVDITTPAMKGFRSDIAELFIDYETLGFFGNFSSHKNSLQVHRIGNYNISIASDKDQLLNRVNWQIFNRPKDFERRISVFDDPGLYPFDCCYVVAQATENIKDDGFGIVYKNRNTDYIPTAHELGEEDMHHYDVKCYHLSTNHEVKIDLSAFRNRNQINNIDEFGGYADGALKKTLREMMTKNNSKVFNLTGENSNNNGIKLEKQTGYKLHKSIQFHPVKMEDGTISKMTIPKIECISYFKINGYFCNANVFVLNDNTDTLDECEVKIHKSAAKSASQKLQLEEIDEEIDEVNEVLSSTEKTIDEENHVRPNHCSIA